MRSSLRINLLNPRSKRCFLRFRTFPPSLEKFNRFIKQIPNVYLAFTGINKLSRYIKGQKDKLPTCMRSNVIYKINCLNCTASYVGQTGRTLKDRISEHRNHINRNTPQSSVITEHRREFLHKFDWDHVEIMYQEAHLNKRLISEMIYIKKQTRGLNLQGDTELLDSYYCDIINNFKKL